MVLHNNYLTIVNQLFHILTECNLADQFAINDQGEDVFHNDLPANSCRQEGTYGHIAAAIKSLGYGEEYEHWVSTGELPDIRERIKQ